YYPHQLAIVRRVLSDPIQRYLLADEVGLGKTIEAGMLIRQHLLDAGRTASVLVLVPSHLEDQWREELAEHFGADGEERIVVLPYESVTEEAPARRRQPNFLVMDEAHQAAGWAWSSESTRQTRYRLIERLAHSAPR